jgi:hypothetical protein
MSRFAKTIAKNAAPNTAPRPIWDHSLVQNTLDSPTSRNHRMSM